MPALPLRVYPRRAFLSRFRIEERHVTRPIGSIARVNLARVVLQLAQVPGDTGNSR